MDPFWTSDEDQLLACEICGYINCEGHEGFLRRHQVKLLAAVGAVCALVVAGVVGYSLGQNNSGSTPTSVITQPIEEPTTQPSTTIFVTPTAPAPVALRIDEQQMLDSVNKEREVEGLSQLTWCEALARSATAHSEDMAQRDYFEHASPEGEEVWNRAKLQGYDYSTVGENIAVGQRSIAEVMDGWMNSPGHRENILNPDYTHLGYGRATGTYEGDAGYIYWTQNFGAGGTC
jgi:uncharacterized protein YkwD